MATIELERASEESRSEADYATLLRQELFGLWKKVLQRRAPEAVAHLVSTEAIDIPTGDAAIPYLQAFSIWFQLQRIVDENSAIRRARLQETEGGTKAVSGSFAEVLSASNLDAATFEKLTEDLRVGPTLTAHPTEAKRVTVLEIHRRIYRNLVALETQRWTPRERDAILLEIEGEIDLLWMTGELRLDRPNLEDEIEWGLQFFRDSIFNAVPQVFEQFERAAVEAFGTPPETRPRIQFHSWIGGDRDGNPNVTTAKTALALQRGRDTAIAMYREHLEVAAARLSISDRVRQMSDAHRQRLQMIIDQGEHPRNPNELFRQAVSAIDYKLASDAYDHISEFIDDLAAIEDSLIAIDAQDLAQRYVRSIRWRALAFGFRTVTLDIRQNSTVTTNVLQEIWKQIDDCDLDYGTNDWSARLRLELAKPDLAELDRNRLSADANELLALLDLMKSAQNGPDPDALGPFILSMTRSADDLLGIYLLARYAGFGRETLDIAVVPLFETIEDLRAAPGVLLELLDVPLARRSLKSQNRPIEIMLGYSDSNKDGGFICSSWELDQAQRKIVRALETLGLSATFFHGRGGSVSRGGAPTGRAIEAQPASTIARQLRITEQGEVVSSKYANRGTAAAHLELLASSVLKHAIAPEGSPEFNGALDALSGLSQTAYVSLLETEGFISYFQQASPVDELAKLRIGSRPARRFGAASLADLRAIPWVFAWSQNRHLITGWYGFGTAISSFRNIRGTDGDEMLRDMFERSKLFRLMVDEVEKSLYHADMEIAAKYATLVEDESIRDRIFGMISTEYERTSTAVKFVTGTVSTGQRFRARRERFGRVNTQLSAINSLQVDLLRDARSNPNGRVPVPLLLSMNAIAAALGWTG